MQPRYYRITTISRMFFSKAFLFSCLLSFALLPAVAQQPAAGNYKDFPLKRLNYEDGTSQCGYYDESNKSLYDCKGNVLKSNSPVLKISGSDYCCGEAAGRLNVAAKSIYFPAGSAKILEKAKPALDVVAEVLNKNPAIKITVETHTDIVGNPDKNQLLSEARAAAIKSYLASKGIDESRISSVGFGETKPIDGIKTATGRVKNSRVELAIQ